MTGDARRTEAVMEVIAEPDWDRPVPNGEAEYGEFLAACAEGRLLIQDCPACGRRQFYPRPLCTACGADPGWLAASGRGVVHTFTVVRQFRGPGFADRVPYVVAMVDLDEGVRMIGMLTEIAPDQVAIGMAVEAYAVEFEPGRALPHWRPSA